MCVKFSAQSWRRVWHGEYNFIVKTPLPVGMEEPSSVLLEVDIQDLKGYLLDPFIPLLRGFDKTVQVAVTPPRSEPFIACAHADPIQPLTTPSEETAVLESRPHKRRREIQKPSSQIGSSHPRLPLNGIELEAAHHAGIKRDLRSVIDVIREEWIKQSSLRGHSEWWADPTLSQHPSLGQLVWLPSHELETSGSSIEWAAIARESSASRKTRFGSNHSSIQVSESGVTLVNSSSKSSKRFLIPNTDSRIILPTRSGFTLTTMEKFERAILELNHESAWDLVIIDPPWQNKSAARARKYRSIELYDLFKLNLPSLLGDNAGKKALVAIWVTNRPKFRRFLKEKFLPDCHIIGPYCDWYWVKITGSPIENDQPNLIKGGKPLFDLDSSSPRRCYEGLVLGWYMPPSLRSNPPLNPLPSKVFFLSVPLSHSRKPNVLDLIQSHLPSNPNILELFSRSVSGLKNSYDVQSDSTMVSSKGRWHSIGDESPKFIVNPWVKLPCTLPSSKSLD